MKKRHGFQNLSELREKVDRLRSYLQQLGSLLVAFSGGVDSSFLVAVAVKALGRENVLAVTATSPIHPFREKAKAKRFIEDRDIRYLVISSNEMENEAFVSNPPDRCYYCKKLFMGQLFEIAKKERLKHVAHGVNKDDLSDFRPGLKAAHELGAVAPLVEADLGKDEIRYLSKQMGLPTWADPPISCLATRIPYGHPITPQKIKMVEQAEEILLEEGFKQVRVRHHGTLARIELPAEDIMRIIKTDLREKLVNSLRAIGFNHISLDLEGYLTGKMNRDLPDNHYEPL